MVMRKRYNGRDGLMKDGNGLYYERARYYDSDSLRFINADTKKGSIDQSATLNLYGYVNGNPVLLVDPMGTSAEPGTPNNPSPAPNPNPTPSLNTPDPISFIDTLNTVAKDAFFIHGDAKHLVLLQNL